MTPRYEFLRESLPHKRLVVRRHLLVAIKRHHVSLAARSICKSQNAIVAKQIERFLDNHFRLDAKRSVAQPVCIDCVVDQAYAERVVGDFVRQLPKRNMRYKDIPFARQTRDLSRVGRSGKNQHLVAGNDQAVRRRPGLKHVFERPRGHETRL